MRFMTTQPKDFAPVAGDTVAVIGTEPGRAHSTAARTTVTTVTASTIAVEGYTRRFNRDTLRSKGDQTYGPSYCLIPVDSPEALRLFADQTYANILRDVEKRAAALRSARDPFETEGLTALVARITQLQERVETYRTAISEAT